MLKKILKTIAIILFILILALFTIPYFFKDQIKEKITTSINENLDAKVSFGDVKISLFKNFPSANISLNQLVIINKAPFVGDTLISVSELSLTMSMKELLKSKDKAMIIEGINSKKGLINIIFNENGVGNYDIEMKDNKLSSSGKSEPLSLKISNYSLENFQFRYTDKKSKVKMILDSINHSGRGDMTKNIVDLDTKTIAKLSLEMDKVKYIKNLKIALDALLGLDLVNQKYTFRKNTAKINELAIEFNGFIKILNDSQQYDLTFKTRSSSFQNFMALIPDAYSSKLKGVKTKGNFNITGFVKGTKSEITIPKFNVAIASNNASFQYSNMPKAMKNIVIDTKVINETGMISDTYVNINKFSFTIDQDIFSAKANFKNLNTNPLIDATIKGTVNLGSLSKAYPMKFKIPMTGILNADIVTNFDMKSVETSQYQNIKNIGNMSLTDFQYSNETGKKFIIKKAIVQFNKSKINLLQFVATTGKSDVAITGILENFYGFMFRNQELKGNFNMVSNQMATSDFMTTKTTKTTNTNQNKEKEDSKNNAIKIPTFLNCTITAKANTVLYDNLILKNVSGKLLIKDQTVSLQNVKTNIFDGLINFNGKVSTKEKIPTFEMNLSLDKVDINSAFTQLEMLKKIAPIGNVITGRLNSTISLNGNLDAKNLTPNLKTLTGNLMGQLLEANLKTQSSPTLSGITSNLKFLDLKKLNLNELKAVFTFKDGKVVMKPMAVKYQDINATIDGVHSFDQSMNYNLKMDVPVKYLGNEVNGLISKLSPSQASKSITIPLSVLLTGTFSKPIISTDIKSAVGNLTTQLVKQQKDKLINQGKTILENLINKKPEDTTKTSKEELKNKAKNLIKGLFGK